MNFSVETWLMFAGRLHPALVHFPIALIMVAAFMEIFRLGRSEASKSARACLAFGALGAILSAFSGWRYAIEGHGGSMPDSLFQHRWGAVIVAVIASLTWFIGCLAKKREGGALLGWYRVGLLFSACLVSYVGFLGGEMVYKPGHLTDVFEAAAKPKHSPAAKEDGIESPRQAPPEPAEGVGEASPEPADVVDKLTSGELEPQAEKPARVDYLTQIQPILEANCYDCHGPTGRAKAGMRLSATDELFEGDSEFWVIQPGNAAGSLLVELVSLSANDEDVMPPMIAGDPADVLSAEQIALISTWIDEGAKFETH